MCSPLLCHVTCKAMTFRPTSVVILLFYHLTIGKLSCPPELKLFSKLPPSPPQPPPNLSPIICFHCDFLLSIGGISNADNPKQMIQRCRFPTIIIQLLHFYLKSLQGYPLKSAKSLTAAQGDDCVHGPFDLTQFALPHTLCSPKPGVLLGRGSLCYKSRICSPVPVTES